MLPWYIMQLLTSLDGISKLISAKGGLDFQYLPSTWKGTQIQVFGLFYYICKIICKLFAKPPTPAKLQVFRNQDLGSGSSAV